MPRPLAVSRPPALPVARFETVLFARLECVGTLRLQRSIRNSGWREEGEDEHVFILRVIRIAYFGALRYSRAPPCGHSKATETGNTLWALT